MVRAEPPTSWLASTRQTDQPASANRNAAANPLGPPPATTASNSLTASRYPPTGRPSAPQPPGTPPATVIEGSVRVVAALPFDRQRQGGAMALQITEVQKALKGVDYPASKDELASHAERNGADRELVDALSGMSKNSFDGPNAVMKELKGSLTGSGD
jgi:Protein of unknown function (DUF2795)